jgi:hypothetical protein
MEQRLSPSFERTAGSASLWPTSKQMGSPCSRGPRDSSHVGVVYTSVAPYRVAKNAKVPGAPMLRVPYARSSLSASSPASAGVVLADPSLHNL